MNDPRHGGYAINTYSYMHDHTAADCLRHLAAQGFSAFELMMYPGHAWPNEMDAAQRKALRALISDNGLRLTTLNMPNVDLNIGGAAPEMRRYTLEILEGVVVLAGELEAPAVVLGPGKFNPLFPARKELLMGWFFEALDRLLPIAERAGTALWVENMPFAFLPSAFELMAALADYGHDGIGVVYDVANAEFIGEDLEAGFEAVRSRLRLVHLSDTGQEVYRHDPVGAGTVPFDEVARHVRTVGYGNLPVLEIISRDPDRDIPESIRRLATLGWEGDGN
jgi:L-ribulose-5-phosphate 3-epimerase